MGEQKDLDQLIVRLAEGDRSAFAPAFQTLWPRVYALSLSLLKHSDDASDAAQQALEKVLTRAAAYDPSRPALPWALGIAAWECRTIRRRYQRRRETSSVQLERADQAESAEHDVIQRELEAAALAALDELSESDRATVISTFWEEAEGAASPALRKRRQRALERLRAAFRRLYEAE